MKKMRGRKAYPKMIRVLFLFFPLLASVTWAETKVIEVTSASTPSQWVANSGTKVAAVDHDDDALYVYEGVAGEIQRYVLADPTGIGASDAIDSVFTKWRAGDNGVGANKARANQVDAEANKNLGTEWSLTTDWTDYSDGPFTERPSGGSWTLSDLNELEVETECTSIGSGKQVACSRLYILIYYTPAGGTPETHRRRRILAGER